MTVIASSKPRCSIVIVTYNSEGVIAVCLEALGAGTKSSNEVIVVDNASSDGTLDLVTSRFPFVRVIKNPQNVGFAQAVNIGVAGSSGETVVLLNPDATLLQGVLDQLINALAANPNVGVVAPWLTDPGNRLAISSAGRDPSVWRMFCHYSGLSRLLGEHRSFEGHYLLPRHLKRSRQVDWVTGACMVVPRNVWDAIGGLSERWFMYAEDVEFCRRVRLAGYAVMFDPELRATHRVGESTSGNHRSSNADWVVNLYDFFASDIAVGGPSRVAWRLVVAGGLSSRAIVYLLKSRLDLGRSKEWAWESKRFTHFAISALRAPNARKGRSE